MKKREYSSDNYYIPGCFYISLDDKDIDRSNFLTSSDFFHEYIHYLQDISLPFLNFKFSHFSERLSSLAAQVYQSSIYCKPFNNYEDPIGEINEKLFSHYFDLDQKSFCYFGSEGTLEIEPVDIKGVSLNNYIFNFQNSIGEKVRYHLSALDLIENLTANIEEAYFGKQNLPDFPYRVVNIIINTLYPHLKLSDHQFCSIIELALYTLDPVGFLFDTLERFTNDDSYNVTDLKKLLFDGVEFSGKSDQFDSKNIDVLQRKAMLHVFSNVENILGNNQFFPETRWIQSRIARGFLKRIESPTFLSDLVLIPDDKKENFRNSLINIYDIPLVHLSNDEIVTSASKDGDKHGDLSLLVAIPDTIVNCLSGQGNKCILMGACMKLEDDRKIEQGTVDNNCLIDPFERELFNSKCPFAIYCQAKNLI